MYLLNFLYKDIILKSRNAMGYFLFLSLQAIQASYLSLNILNKDSVLTLSGKHASYQVL